MATLNIIEFNVLGTDSRNYATMPAVPPVAKDTLTYSSKTESAAFVGNLVRLLASADCYVQFGTTVDVTTDDLKLVANQPEYFAVTPGHKLDVWDGSTP